MSITPYLGDFDASPETKRVLDVALEMTRVSLGLETVSPTESSLSKSSNLLRPASAIPISCLKARSRNYAGICTQTNKQNAGLASKLNASTVGIPCSGAL